MTQTNTQKKLSILSVLTNPMSVVSAHLGQFLIIGGIFSLISLLISYMSGQPYGCRFTPKDTWCADPTWWRVGYLILKVCLTAVFFMVWDKVSTENMPIKKAFQSVRFRPILIGTFVLLLFMGLNFLPVISIAELIRRVPNPNWHIELLYFWFVSIGFWVPFILMRFYAVLPPLLTGSGKADFALVWKNTSGEGIKLVLATSLIFMFICFLMLGTVNTLGSRLFSVSFWYGVWGEFAFDMIGFLALAILFSYWATLRALLLASDK